MTTYSTQDLTRSSLENITTGGYETVAASQTDQVMGGAGAKGDYIVGILVVPATVSPGAISIKDGSGSAITVFTGGTLVTVTPFYIPLGMTATTNWKVTTGSNVSVIAFGRFT